MRKSIGKRIRLIKSHRLYSTKELAGEVGVHQRTIQEWQKQGLSPIDPHCKPFIFRGQDAKAFLSARRKARKQTLQDREFFCTKCRKPMKSIAKDISLRAMGSSNRLFLNGKCEKCGTTMNRFVSQNQFQNGVFGGIAGKADIRLYESQPANVNTDLGKGMNHE